MDKPIIYVGLDVHKDTIAVALAEAGKRGEVRQFGQIANTPAALKGAAARHVTAECPQQRHHGLRRAGGPGSLGLGFWRPSHSSQSAPEGGCHRNDITPALKRPFGDVEGGFIHSAKFRFSLTSIQADFTDKSNALRPASPSKGAVWGHLWQPLVPIPQHLRGKLTAGRAAQDR